MVETCPFPVSKQFSDNGISQHFCSSQTLLGTTEIPTVFVYKAWYHETAVKYLLNTVGLKSIQSTGTDGKRMKDENDFL